MEWSERKRIVELYCKMNKLRFSQKKTNLVWFVPELKLNLCLVPKESLALVGALNSHPIQISKVSETIQSVNISLS